MEPNGSEAFQCFVDPRQVFSVDWSDVAPAPPRFHLVRGEPHAPAHQPAPIRPRRRRKNPRSALPRSLAPNSGRSHRKSLPPRPASSNSMVRILHCLFYCVRLLVFPGSGSLHVVLATDEFVVFTPNDSRPVFIDCGRKIAQSVSGSGKICNIILFCWTYTERDFSSERLSSKSFCFEDRIGETVENC